MPGDRVRLFDHASKKWLTSGSVSSEAAPRSYNIHTDIGGRNRRDLRVDPKPRQSVPVDLLNEEEPETTITSPTACASEKTGETLRRYSRNIKPPDRLIELC